jgi:hypothetical protein
MKLVMHAGRNNNLLKCKYITTSRANMSSHIIDGDWHQGPVDVKELYLRYDLYSQPLNVRAVSHMSAIGNVNDI